MNILSSLVEPVLNNLFGYDLLIILVAIFTLGYFLFVMWHSDKVYSSIFTQGYMPDDEFDEEEKKPPTKKELKEKKNNLRSMRETSEKYYSMFVNLTSIFPLMGILGTVIALIPMVDQLADMEGSFFVALTSTLWGLLFAIVFKMLDGILTPRLDRNERGIEDYLESLERKIEEMKEMKTTINQADSIVVQDEVVMVGEV